MIETSEQLAELQAKATLYSLLAQAFNYPDAKLVQVLCGGEFTSALREAITLAFPATPHGALEDLKREYANSPLAEDAVLLELERDYTHMFFASKPRVAHLFESVYKEGKLLDESTFQIARLYCDAGLTLTEDFRLPPDHIAVELEFLSFLFFKQIEGQRSGNKEITEYAGELQAQVMNEHLRAFAASLAERVIQHARTSFYRSMAVILQAVC